MIAPPVEAKTKRSTPASAVPRSISSVPRAFTSKFSKGSVIDSTTEPNAARWMTRSAPLVARATTSGSRMSPTTSSMPLSAGSSSRDPRVRLSSTLTSYDVSNLRSRLAPMKPAPPVTRTSAIVRPLAAERCRAQRIRGVAPVDARQDQVHVDLVAVLDRDVDERVEQRVAQVVRLQPEVEQRCVRGVVVVLFSLDPRVLERLDLGGDPELLGGVDDEVGELADRELLGELVEDAHLTRFGGVEAGELDAAHGVADVEVPARLAALAVDGQRMADRGLHAETVERGAQDVVVVKAVDQARVALRLIGDGAVDDALVQVGGAQPPDAAGEVDVGRVVNLRAVVEARRQLRVGQAV